MTTQSVTIVLETSICPTCGLVFGIETTHYQRLRKSGETFYCPSGHSIWFGESEADKLKRQLADSQSDLKWWEKRAKENLAEAEFTKHRLAATKGVLTKTKKRISNGVCPCCHRQFVSLANHMKNQHPDYNKEKNEDNN